MRRRRSREPAQPQVGALAEGYEKECVSDLGMTTAAPAAQALTGPGQELYLGERKDPSDNPVAREGAHR
jgi:hypothetical protein